MRVDRRARLGGRALALAAVCSSDVAAQERLRWKLAAGYPSTLPVIGRSQTRVTEEVEGLTDGDFQIRFYEPGALVPLRRVPGGLAMSITLMGTILAATTGIIGASVVMMTLLALPTTLERGYDKRLATGTIAASGTLGILIPPSIMLVAIIFALGFFFEWIEITLIMLPIMYPILGTLDFGGHVAANETVLWFAIVVAVNLQTSFLTPPFGFALFYMKGVAPQSVGIEDIYRGIVPFVGLQLLGLALVIAFPAVAL